MSVLFICTSFHHLSTLILYTQNTEIFMNSVIRVFFFFQTQGVDKIPNRNIIRLMRTKVRSGRMHWTVGQWDCLRSKLIQTFQLDINLDLWDFFLEYYNWVFSFLRLTSRFSFPVPFVFSELSGGNAHGTSKHFSEQIFERMRPGRNFFAWNWKTCTQFFSTLQCRPCHTLFRF